ncbi:caspase family protein [Kitasatospora sp. NPDC094028]
MIDRVGRFSALLIGAADYVTDPLPFVPRDLEHLGEALEARGVGVQLPRPREGAQVTRNFVIGEVSSFLARAEPGDRLVIGLSGHGVHANGHDYLVPEDIHLGQSPYSSGCIRIGWQQELQETDATQVLFLIDACRQGIRDSMGPPRGWSASRMRTVANRKVARLYACAPGELSRFVTVEESTASSGDGSFSLFSRAVRDVLLSHEGPLNLDELRAKVHGRVNALHHEHRKAGRAQEVRLLTEAVHKNFVVVGELRTRPVPVLDSGAAPEVPPAPVVKDPAKLMADALHQVATSGRTEFLEEFAVMGSTAGLLELSGLAMPRPALDAMWTAAVRGRDIESLVELTGALHGAGRPDLAHRIVESVVGARPDEAAGFAALLGNRGPADLLPIVFTALCSANVDQVADFLRAAQGDGGGSLLSMLAASCPVAELSLLIARVVDDSSCRSVYADLWQRAAEHRPMADLLTMLEDMPEAAQPALLDWLVRACRVPGDLAELVEMPGHPALRERLGGRAAVGLRAYDDAVLKDVLAELGSRGWEAGSCLLITRIVRTRTPLQQAVLVVGLEADGHGRQARALITGACGERDTESVGALAEELLSGPQPQLGEDVLDHAAQRWQTGDLVWLWRRLAATGVRTGSQPIARGAGYLLSRAVDVCSPEQAADLLLALDAEPHGDPALLGQLLDCYLAGRAPEDFAARIILLRGARPGSLVALRVSDVVWANAPVLFHAAERMRGSEVVTASLLAVWMSGTPVVLPALLGLLAGLRMSGGQSTANFVRDTAVRSQRPDVVASYLVTFQTASRGDFAEACRALGGRAAREVAEVLVAFAGLGGGVGGFASWYSPAVEQDRCRELLCELLDRGEDWLASEVLSVVPWLGVTGPMAALFLDADRHGVRQVELLSAWVAVALYPPLTVELIEYLGRHGAPPRICDSLIRALARSENACAGWIWLQSVGRFERAAGLLDSAPREVNIGAWYRDLVTTPVEIDHSAMEEASGADVPLSRMWLAPSRSALAAAVLFRPPPEVVEVLARVAVAGEQAALEELWRVLAVARSVCELVSVLETLVLHEQHDDVRGIVDAVLAEEPRRVAEFLHHLGGARLDADFERAIAVVGELRGADLGAIRSALAELGDENALRRIDASSPKRWFRRKG